MVKETIKRVLDFYNLKSEIGEDRFVAAEYIPERYKGVYVISKNDLAIYVGKGVIKNRNRSHLEKMLADATNVPEGWRILKEDSNFNNPEDWTLNYILLDKETQRTAVEGSLIYFLTPKANDETISDLLKEV
ncbi:GIY-YIG nuclease family protein [bacterium]|nr:GIY-YIG nuclease family protein [bacterium]